MRNPGWSGREDVYGKQIEPERKETDEFLAFAEESTAAAGMITLEQMVSSARAPQRVGTVHPRESGLCSRPRLK